MRLVRIRATDFMAYADLDLDLDGVGQIAVVGTGPEGSNGAGKTALLEAVLWCLSGQARIRDGRSQASSDDLVRDDCPRTFVETTWVDHTGRTVVVTRKRDRKAGKSDLSLKVDGVNRTSATIADTQAAIMDAIGLPMHVLLAGPIMAQGEADALMRAGPAERKEILSSLFELERYAVWADAAKIHAAQAAATAAASRQRVERLRAAVDEEFVVRQLKRDAEQQIARARGESLALNETVLTLREQAIRMHEHASQIEGLKQQERDWANNLDHATAQLADLDATTVTMRETVATAVPGPQEDEILRLEELEQSIRGFVEATDKAKLIEQVPCGGEGIYATCQFLVQATAAAATVEPLEQRILTLGGPTSIESIQVDKRHARMRDRDRAALVERQGQAQKWIDSEAAVRESLESQLGTARNHIKEIRARIDGFHFDGDAAAKVARDLSDVTVALHLAESEVESGQRSLGSAEERLRIIATAKTELAEASALEEASAAEELQYRALAKAFGRDGIPTLIIENGIPMIEQRANELLARMPGGFSVSLVTQRENKSGAIRDTLDLVVGIRGRERPYSMLSGGERLRVDFAIRVAQSDVATRRKGKTFETLWIDEGFGTQDRLGREALLEAISAVAEDFGLIVVVSHMDDITDRIETKLVVTKDSDGVATAEIIG